MVGAIVQATTSTDWADGINNHQPQKKVNRCIEGTKSCWLPAQAKGRTYDVDGWSSGGVSLQCTVIGWLFETTYGQEEGRGGNWRPWGEGNE